MLIIDEEFVSRLRAVEYRYWPKVDKTETCWLWTAYKRPTGYGLFTVEEHSYGAHRIAYALAHGPIPDGMNVDHLCHNPSCVNPAHLRLATTKQNAENHQGPTIKNTSGYRGVSHRKGKITSPWQAIITHNQRSIWVGCFATAEQANEAVIAKRLELFTHNDQDRTAA